MATSEQNKTKVEVSFDSTTNVWARLLAVRKALSDLRLQQGGKNDYSKYSYFELGDFEPSLISLCEKYRIIPIVDYGSTVSTLTVVNVDDPTQTIVFHSPMPDLNLSMQKGNTLMQTQGSLETYTRRYLYLTAFELVQQDTEEKEKERQDELEANGKTGKGKNAASVDSNPYNQDDVNAVVSAIGKMLATMQAKEGSMQKFSDYKTTVLNNPNFSCQKATPADYSTLKNIQKFLIESGYSGSSL